LTKLHAVVADLKSDNASLAARTKAAEAAQVSANVDRTWFATARQQLEAGLQEFASGSAQEAALLAELCDRVQQGVTQLTGAMLALEGSGGSLEQAAPRGTLAALDPKLPRWVAADLAEASRRLAALVESERRTRQLVLEQLEVLDQAQGGQVAEATQFWRQALQTAQQEPGTMRAFLLSANKVVHPDMEPSHVLAELVPSSLLEQQAAEIRALRQKRGELQAVAAKATATASALEKSCALERQVAGAAAALQPPLAKAADQRQAQYLQLVANLQAKITVLDKQVAAAQGGRLLAENMAKATARKLGEAEFVAEGRPVEVLGLPDLGIPVLEAMAPALHFTLHHCCRCLELELAPELGPAAGRQAG
ncbi:uncharacterized protein HaLaN_04770, partial [Haematococcus lacustris]